MKRRKEIVDFHVNEDTVTEASHPVDYSFFKYKELRPVGCEQARITRLGDAPERGKENKKYLTKGIWLNNNKLTSIRAMDTLVNAVLENPQKLAWIDFSYNYIRDIDEIILRFPNLTIVNFHGNRIKDITEVAKLRALKKLRNITFHGNPIAQQKNYRAVIIAYLPTVVHLDFQPVLKSERLTPVPPDALKYLKTLDALKQKPKEESGDGREVPAKIPAEKPEALLGGQATRKEKRFAGPKPAATRPFFSSKGPCACVLSRKLCANTQID